MNIVDKPFRFYTDVPIDICHQRIVSEFRDLNHFHELTLYTILSDKADGFVIQIELSNYQRRDYPAYITIEAEVVPHQSDVQIKGHAVFTKYTQRYFAIFALLGLLLVPVIFVEWWLIFGVICWYGAIIGNTYYIWDVRNELIQTMCNLLR